jgi:predicted enzyme related to lactoylglutathione lyase
VTTLQGLMEVILYVQDMASQVAFYRDRLGLILRSPANQEDFNSAYWVEFETGACSLVLHGGGQKRSGPDAPKIVFRVQDIQVAQNELRDRGVVMGELRSPAPDVWVSDGADPEGNAFSIESHAPLAEPIRTTYQVPSGGPYTGTRRVWTV